MNLEKVFDALGNDNMNSGLGIICSEFENQGYSVLVDNIHVDSDDIFAGEHSNLEKKLGLISISLHKNGVLEQSFAIEFVDFHEIVIKKRP